MTIDALAEARAIAAEIIELRHDLHRHPEVGTHLPWTQARVLAALDGLPLEVTLGRGLSSVVAVLRGAADPDLAERPVVLLRGDMDGLPVAEATGLPYASQEPGRMHACGHDLHTATLVGAAKILCAHAAELPGDVVLMFQPGEEVLAGAREMLAEGLLDAAGKRPDRAFGLHAMAALYPAGTFALRPGTAMAASDLFVAGIVGRGGHGSTPHLAVDPVPAMAEAILALQVAVTRRFSIVDPVVVNVGVANAGAAPNVIPEACHVEGSVRSFSREARQRAAELLPAVVRDAAALHGCTAEIEWRPGVGPTVNDADLTAFAVRQLEDLFGADRVEIMADPLAGSEDFSLVLDEVPGAFIFYSAVPAGADPAAAAVNHSATATFSDDAIADAVAGYVRLATASLTELTRPS